MSVRPIRIAGDPVLHRASQPVKLWDAELEHLVQDMIDTMREAPGVGLAAPQIGVPLQVFVWDWEDDEGAAHEGAIINPSLIKGPPSRGRLDEEADAEGCLSVPDLRYPRRRSDHVVLTGWSLAQLPLSIPATGWLARIFQHEWDHLQGHLYVKGLSFWEGRHAKRDIRDAGWGKPGHSWTPGVDDYENSDHHAEEA
ncbi:MAG: peptide deformylase [Pontimonas sp.]